MGESQIMYISCFLAGNYKIYLFDEPNSNLDQENRIKFAEALKNKQKKDGSIFIVTSHIEDKISNYADNILTIKNRKVMKYSSDTSSGYLLQLDNKEVVAGKFSGIDYFFYKNFLVVRNIGMSEIINLLGEEHIIEIRRISGSMVSFYETFH